MVDVLAGRPTDEAERRLSQVGRIHGDPDLITITIGGNDIGFAKTLGINIGSGLVENAIERVIGSEGG